jgi:hypothetical protein
LKWVCVQLSPAPLPYTEATSLDFNTPFSLNYRFAHLLLADDKCEWIVNEISREKNSFVPI